MDGVTGSGEQGFSLVELMVVVAALAVLSVSVTLSFARPADEGGADAARFLGLHESLRDGAILSREVRALDLATEGWQILSVGDAAGGRGPDGWRPVGQGGRFRGEARFTFAGITRVPEAAPDGVPDLVFLPDGRSTPFEAAFVSADGVTRCAADGWAPPTCGDR